MILQEDSVKPLFSVISTTTLLSFLYSCSFTPLPFRSFRTRPFSSSWTPLLSFLCSYSCARRSPVINLTLYYPVNLCISKARHSRNPLSRALSILQRSIGMRLVNTPPLISLLGLRRTTNKLYLWTRRCLAMFNWAITLRKLPTL